MGSFRVYFKEKQSFLKILLVKIVQLQNGSNMIFILKTYIYYENLYQATDNHIVYK